MNCFLKFGLRVIWYLRNMVVVGGGIVWWIVCHFVPNVSNVWRQAVVCWRLRWGSGHMMWCPGTSLLKTALSRALHPPCIQMCHQAGYALAFTQSQALMSSIQPFTFTKKSGVTILLGSMLPLTVVLYTKLASNKQVVAFRRIANWSSRMLKTLLLLIFNLSMPLLVDLLQGLWGF